jgi:hypothetical protein
MRFFIICCLFVCTPYIARAQVPIAEKPALLQPQPRKTVLRHKVISKPSASSVDMPDTPVMKTLNPNDPAPDDSVPQEDMRTRVMKKYKVLAAG